MSLIEVRGPTRHVPLDTVFNLRDLGGYFAGDGQTIAWGRLYRADGLHRLAGPDLDRVRSLGLRTVVDLRTAGELDEGRFPVRSHPVAYHHLPVLARTWHEEEVDALAELADRATPYLVARYIDLLAEGGPLFARAVTLMTEPAACPFVFHCAAGKDRTGVLSALVLGVLGVTDDDIVADYALSVEAMTRMQAWVTANRPEVAEVLARQPVGWLAAPPEAMVALLAHLRRAYGGAEAYFADHGVDRFTVEALRELLLV